MYRGWVGMSRGWVFPRIRYTRVRGVGIPEGRGRLFQRDALWNAVLFSAMFKKRGRGVTIK